MAKSRNIMKFYKTKSDILTTMCPNIIVGQIGSDSKCHIFIGSDSCIHCKYFVSMDEKKLSVECKYGFMEESLEDDDGE